MLTRIGLLLVAALAAAPACEKKSTEQQPAAQAKQAERQSEQAFAQAKQAQERARTEQEQAAKAQQALQQKRLELQQAQRLADTETLEAQQAQQQAQLAAQQAHQIAQQTQAQRSGEQQVQRVRGVEEPALQPAPQPQPLPQPQPGAQPAPGAEQPSASTTAIGTVQSVTPTAITVARPGQPPLVLTIAGDTTVMIQGQQRSAAELRPGMPVEITYVVTPDQTVATKIESKGDTPPQ